MIDFPYDPNKGSVYARYMAICHLSENSNIYEYQTPKCSGFFMVFLVNENLRFIFPEGYIGEKTVLYQNTFSLEEVKDIFEKDINLEKDKIFGVVGNINEGRNNKTFNECLLDFRYLMLSARTMETIDSSICPHVKLKAFRSPKEIETSRKFKNSKRERFSERLKASTDLLNSLIYHFSERDFSDYPKENIEGLNVLLEEGITQLKNILHELENPDPKILNRILPSIHLFECFCQGFVNNDKHYFGRRCGVKSMSFHYLNGHSIPMHRYLEERKDKESHDVESFFGPLENMSYSELLSMKENLFIMISKYMEEIFKSACGIYTLEKDYNHRLFYR